MERLKTAGLNPNLVYGNGATTTANNITDGFKTFTCTQYGSSFE